MSKSPATALPRVSSASAPRLSLIRSALNWAWMKWERTRMLHQLAELSDEHLKDIGVERRAIGDVVERELQRLRRRDLTIR